MINSRAVAIAATVGTILQIGMVVLGHTNSSVKAMFAVGGMGLSLLAGLIYALNARGSSMGSLATGGAVAGGICAFIGILVSCFLGDVPASLLLLGTVSSVVTGAIGGAIGKFFSGSAAVAVFIALSFSAPSTAKAQSVATTKDFSWLVGRWQGTMTSGAGVADVTFQPAVAGLMTGVMKIVSGDKILVVELISIVDTPNGPEMRFRHFSASLDAYEQSFKQALRLKTHSADKDVFENMVPYDKALMSTQPRLTTFQRFDADTFTGHSDIIGDDGKPAVIEVKYRRLPVSRG